ncbi:MAG: hypothetical protein JO056_12510 [Alphaproteobacteria bacterium]|nr:hypothetical protein [Alphaproteobacteria bacterium]
MKKVVLWTAVILLASVGTTNAQELAAYQPNACQKLAAGQAASNDRATLYTRAACVAARAAVAAPGNGPLSREELLSILVLMSLQQAKSSHAS